MAKRKPELVKPEGISIQEWIFRLESEKRYLMRQLRREVHTRGNTVQNYCDRIDRALLRAKEADLIQAASAAAEAPCDHPRTEQGVQ